MLRAVGGGSGRWGHRDGHSWYLWDCWGKGKAKGESEMVRCCQAVEGFDIHPKEFGLHSVANGDPWKHFQAEGSLNFVN